MTEWPMLVSLSDDDRRRLLAAGRRRRFARKEVIFHEGDPGDSLHLVERGHVAVRVTTGMGEVATLSIVSAGGTFGELSLLDDAAHRSASVIALEATETWALHRDQFQSLRRAHPTVDQFLIELLVGYVKRLSEMLTEALFLPADRRVVRRVLALAPLFDGEPGAGPIPLTQDDLASLAGTSRATVNRVLGELVEAGALAVGRGRITVLDHSRLDRAAR